MWYEVPTVDITDWLVNVTDLFGAVLDEVLGVPVFTFFVSFLLCMAVLALFFISSKHGRK